MRQFIPEVCLVRERGRVMGVLMGGEMVRVRIEIGIHAQYGKRRLVSSPRAFPAQERPCWYAWGLSGIVSGRVGREHGGWEGFEEVF